MRITAHRIIDTVLAIPIGDQVSTDDVIDHLSGLGYDISKRSVERDLVSLAGKYGIERRGRKEWARTARMEPQ